MDFNGYSGHLVRYLLLGMAIVAGPALADDAPGFDRPGYGFAPGALPAGGLALEQGLPTWTLGNDSGTRSSLYSTDSLLRIGLGAHLELQLGSTPFNRLSEREATSSTVMHGRGDSTLGLKLGLPSASDAWSWGVLGTMEFTDGARGIRNDRRQYTLGLVAVQQVDEDHQWSYFAQDQRSGNQSSYQLAADYNIALDKHWGVYGEAAAVHEDGRSGMQLGNGFTWQPNARVQWDAWWRRRVAGDANDWEGGLGVAVYFAGP
ncbi:MAG TPA: transporter [Dyella sp.]|uniref:transporter n=1 Tax=Dyella sp. TaxID=1869338 RepID=UPI002F95C74C